MAASFREILLRTSDARFEELMAIIEIHNGYSVREIGVSGGRLRRGA
jgi:hypothetical protein